MRDYSLVAFLFALMMFGFKRPFIFVLAYAYVDIVSPQRLSYFLLNSIPVSLICFVFAVGGWLFVDDKKGTRFAPRQWLLLSLLIWVAFTTHNAVLHEAALSKWDWVWKALVFAIFLPLTLRTKLRMEALLVFMTLSASSIIIVGAIKTLASGGGYGTLNLMIENNSGLYEGSTISTVAVAIVPLVLYLSKHVTIFPADNRARLFCLALAGACLLIPIGTETRTGLLCIALLGILMLRATKRRALYIALISAVTLVAMPLLPESFSNRMDKIQGYQSDSSASTRIAVWKWTMGYVADHPLGGGFEIYRLNRMTVALKDKNSDPNNTTITTQTQEGRAFHSAYFEILGEQGIPGIFLWGLFHLSGLIGMEMVRRRYIRSTDPGEAWIAPLATALQHGQLIYLLGAAFIGVAFQPFIFMLLGVQIALGSYCKRHPPTVAKATA